MHLVLLGPPASGKGTQGRRLAEHFDLAYLSTGGLLRKEITAGTDVGKQAKILLDQGQYVPDSLILPLVQAWCASHPEGWVLDGFPRTLSQAQILVENTDLTQAIVLDVPLPELKRRVSSRKECPFCHYVSSNLEVCPKCTAQMETREDDSLENFTSRHQNFQKLTLPAIQYLEEQNLVIHIKGEHSPEEITRDLITQISK